MRISMTRCLAAALGALVVMASPAVAQEKLQPRPEGAPVFFHWLNTKNPGDRAIVEYWSKVKAHKASAAEMLDLGTMLYKHGFPEDAIKMYHETAKTYPNLAEPWFLAGLVEHERSHFKAARRNYKRCLKILTGNGWCNFYMGLVEEQLGDPFDAMHFYNRAFRFDPDLANPKINPEVLKSRLQLGALVRHLNREQFAEHMPMKYYESRGLQEFKSGLTPSARRRRALERSHGVVHKPKKIERRRKVEAPVRHPAVRPHRSRRATPTARTKALEKAHAKSEAAHAKEFEPRFTVKTVPPKPVPTPNPNRMPWGSSWRPPKKTPKAQPPKTSTPPKATPPKK